MYIAAAGLKVLRENNIIHRDLKPQVCVCLACTISSDIYCDLIRCMLVLLVSLRSVAVACL